LDETHAAIVCSLLRSIVSRTAGLSAIVASCRGDLLEHLRPDQTIECDYQHYTLQAHPSAAYESAEGGFEAARESGGSVSYLIPSYLDGALVLGEGVMADYQSLARFHYLNKRPATLAKIWSVYHHRRQGESRAVAVGVLSYPTLAMAVRERVLGLDGLAEEERRTFVNRHIRTISRVVVHPAYRSLGLAKRVIQCLIHHCNTRYVEAVAMMGRAHPVFERAGMRAYEADGEGTRPVYYLFDRQQKGGGFTWLGSNKGGE